MFFEPGRDGGLGDTLIERARTVLWGVDSEYGRLTDVMLSPPAHLEMVPCNSVTRESIAEGLECCTDTAARDHSALIALLEERGVRCHMTPPRADLADLSFMRDAALMTPWGLIALNPAAPHRRDEVQHVRAAAQSLGVTIAPFTPAGTLEGGDICIVRPGLVIIGYSGDRTDKAGARSLASFFEARGWDAIFYCFDPRFLHLDTQFTMVGRNEAVACIDALEEGFRDSLSERGIRLIPASLDEVRRLGANLLSLGEGRVVSPVGNVRINAELRRRGYEVAEVEVGQFTRCGGGVHCLTLPLARDPG